MEVQRVTRMPKKTWQGAGRGLLGILILGGGFFFWNSRRPLKDFGEGSAKMIWQGFQEKLQTMRALNEENQSLRKQNAHLRVELESQKFLLSQEAQQRDFHHVADKLQKEVGSILGHLPASLPELAHVNFNSTQELVLGMTYFKAGDYERATAVLGRLHWEVPDSFEKGIKLSLVKAVSWYQVGNYFLADRALEETLHVSQPTPAMLPYLAQARLWKALVAHRLKKKIKVQYWLQELIDHHPHSQEAQWINALPRSRLRKQ